MLKPPTPNVAGMTDTLDFVKNLWGNMNVPGVTGPGLSTEELDKRISDLKAVEAWLNMNLTMLRGTIQGLEVQRGTIATLKSMSASMAQAMSQPGADAATMPFQQFFASFGAGGPAGDAQSATQPSAQPQQPTGGAAQSQQQAAAGTQPAGEVPPSIAAMPAALAWWNLLQDQFKQAVASTISPEAMANAAAAAQEAATRFSAATMPPAESGSTGNASTQPGTSETKPRPSKPKGDKS